MSQEPSMKLLVAVINYSLWLVKIYYSECALILDDLSYVCLTLFKYKNIVLMSSLSWKNIEFLMV